MTFNRVNLEYEIYAWKKAKEDTQIHISEKVRMEVSSSLRGPYDSFFTLHPRTYIYLHSYPLYNKNDFY